MIIFIGISFIVLIIIFYFLKKELDLAKRSLQLKERELLSIRENNLDLRFISQLEDHEKKIKKRY